MPIDRDRLRALLIASMPESAIVSDAKSEQSILVAHRNHVVTYEKGPPVPAATSILCSSPVEQDFFQASLAQTWDWPEARRSVATCTHRVIVVEMLSLGLEYRARTQLFLDVLRAVLMIVSPVAICCRHAERIMQPRVLVEALNSADPITRAGSMFNVRLFRIEGSGERDTVMDTMGLYPLGLPDFQIHSRDLDHSRLAGFLYSLAAYCFERGNCIESGNTVQGLEPEQKWKCQLEESIAAPRRIVIDIDPGEPFAAGKRSR